MVDTDLSFTRAHTDTRINLMVRAAQAVRDSPLERASLRSFRSLLEQVGWVGPRRSTLLLHAEYSATADREGEYTRKGK